MDSQNWNYNEFVTFLLIYAAHADVDYSVDEQDFIKGMIDDASYQKIYGAFEGMTDIQVLNTIASYKGKYFPTSTQKQELIAKIEQLFRADGDYSSMEKTLKLFLDHLL